MKVQHKIGNITRNTLDSVRQTIAKDKIATAVMMLRDKIYTDKFKAAVQETICNAVDEHRKYSVSKPVAVVITEAEICIRDFANGLDKDGVLHTFFQFFASTKDTTNAAIGGFGIGAKAPGAYTEIWTVESWHNGLHSVYTSVTEGQEATASLVFVEECPSEETGIMVRIPLQENTQGVEQCLQSIASMVGFYEQDPPVRLYKTTSYATLEDLFAAEDNCKSMLDIVYSKYSDKVWECPVLRLRDLLLHSDHGEDGQMYMLSESKFQHYVPYSFWHNGQIFFYDGDVLYRGDDRSMAEVRKVFSELEYDIHYMTTIIMFERGELSVSPSRETIEVGDAATSLAMEKALHTYKTLTDRAMQELQSNLSDICAEIKRVDDKCVSTYYNTYRVRHSLYHRRCLCIMRACRFEPDARFVVKDANNASQFSLISKRDNGDVPASNLANGSCLVYAPGAELCDVARRLRSWVEHNGGYQCKYDYFYVFVSEASMKRAKEKCTIGNRCIISASDMLFPIEHFNVAPEERIVRPKRSSRQNAPITLYRYGIPGNVIIPESEYKTTLFFTVSQEELARRMITERFYEAFGYTGVTVASYSRVGKLKRLGLTDGSELINKWKRLSTPDKLKMLSCLYTYIKKKKLVIADTHDLSYLSPDQFTRVSSYWGSGCIDSSLSRFVGDLRHSFERAIKDALKQKLSREEYFTMNYVAEFCTRGHRGLFDYYYLRDLYTELREGKYKKLINKVFRSLPYNKILKDTYETFVNDIKNNKE